MTNVLIERLLKEPLYDAHVAEGFTEKEALELCKTLQL